MSKSPTPKEIMKNHIKNRKLLKLPKPEFDSNKIQSITVNNKIYETRNRDVTDDGFPNPFKLPKNMRLFSKELAPRKQHLLPEAKDNVRTICDIHKDFFNVIEGRPLKQDHNIKVYMGHIRDLADCRTNIGFRKDEMERIDHDLREEMEQFEKVHKLCNACRKNFAQYLKLSFAVAKESQDNAAKVADQLDKMSDQLEEYSFEYVRLRNGLAVVMGNYEKLLRYKNFLTSLAPSSWQKKFGTQGDQQVTRIRAKLNSNLDIISVPSAASRESISSLEYVKPAIFFTEPRQIMSMFDVMCRQGQHYLSVVNNTSRILSLVHKHRKNFEYTLKYSGADMKDDIEKYSNIIQSMKERETECKTKFFEILFNDFRRLYANYDNIKLHTCVQDVYNHIFGEPEDVKDKTIVLMRRLERLYMELLSDLDDLDITIVKAATKESFTKDVDMMAKAHHAQRQLQLSDILQKALYASFEPPRDKTRTGRIKNNLVRKYVYSK